jgi:hypothetical protein
MQKLEDDKVIEFRMQLNRLSKKFHLRTLNEISKIINSIDIFENVNAELTEALDNVYEILKNEYQIYNPKD